MSVIEKALKKAGLKVQADTLPKEQRGVKPFQRFMAALRVVEAEAQDLLTEAQNQLNEQLRVNLQQQQRIHSLEAELLRYRLKEGLGEIEALTTHDRTKLLELSRANGGG